MTALMLAAWKGEIKTARLLLEHGADIDIRSDFFDRTALMIAEEEGHDDIAKLIKDTIVSRENAKKMVRNKQVLAMSKGINDKNSTVQNLDLDVFSKVMDYAREQKPNEIVIQSEIQRPQSKPNGGKRNTKKRSKHKGGKRGKSSSKKRSKHKGGKRGKSSIKKRSKQKGGNKRNNKK